MARAPSPAPFVPGYHLRPIEKGVFGEASKIREEAEELVESLEQGARIMALNELADLYGAMEDLLTRAFPDFTMQDLAQMAAITRRAFQNGRRS